MSGQEVLTVRQSEDGKAIRIEGTAHPLWIVAELIKRILADPGPGVIRAVNQKAGTEIIIELLSGGVESGHAKGCSDLGDRPDARHDLLGKEKSPSRERRNTAQDEGTKSGSSAPPAQKLTDEEFNQLLAGPLDHPLIPFKFSRLLLCLRDVVEQTGDAGAAALRAHCRARQEQDERIAEEF